MLRGLRSWWRSYRLRKRLKKDVEKIDAQVRDLLRKEHVDFTKSPVVYAEKVLGMKPFPYQAKLLEDDSKRIVACMGRQTGKTTTIAMKAIYFADTNPDVLVLITSPSLRQSMIMFDRIATFVYGRPYLRNKIVRATRTLIHFDNGSRIIALPCSENLLRGYTADMCICDEAAFMPEEVITQVIFPMLSTTNGYAIFLSTPWGKDHFFIALSSIPPTACTRLRRASVPS